MTDTELILQHIDRVYDGVKRLEVRMDGLEERMDRLEQKVDRLEGRMDCLEQKVDSLDSKIIHVEFGLGQEIQKVYELTLQNAENIKELIPLKDRLVKAENRQDLIESLVVAHGREIREIRARLA